MKKWSEIKQATLDKLFLTIDEADDQGYLSKFRYLANECLNIIANGVKPRVKVFNFEIVEDKPGLVLQDNQYVLSNMITMPEDFLSFADMVMYHNNTPYDEIVYLDDKSFVVGELGKYFIFYNATWDNVSEEDIQTDKPLTTDTSVLNCLPTYIASQCLSQDDVQRSAILKNEFELMLSRLDTNIMYQNNHFRSSGGWY